MAKACDKGRALDVASCPSLLRRGTGFVPEKGSTCPNSCSKAVRGVASLEPYILHRVSASCPCARRLLLGPLSDPPFSSSSDLSSWRSGVWKSNRKKLSRTILERNKYVHLSQMLAIVELNKADKQKANRDVDEDDNDEDGGG
ncbi:unnamed protein product [Musa acuminata subsp. malaccensis]|uniref:(wild Malaysian banana) hypothetical protein n=1 Tax=Musa acuminata subsp. malaccensis TaxID=214687 RepID=A0A804KQG1_MUSAM|nr:unnamed protein product [Musa acuminata subsp. malaccensis]